MPECVECGECFSNWDRILEDLRTKTQNTVGKARRVKVRDTLIIELTVVCLKPLTKIINRYNKVALFIPQDHGAAGAYTSKFKQLDKELEEIREILRSASITQDELLDLQRKIDVVSNRTTETTGQLDG